MTHFPATSLTVFERIRTGDDRVRQAAFGDLVAGYWRPSYHYLRRYWRPGRVPGARRRDQGVLRFMSWGASATAGCSVLGLIVGYAAQRYGTGKAAA